MNKFFTKIAAATVGFAMAIGVGVGVAQNANAVYADPVNASVSMDSFGWDSNSGNAVGEENAANIDTNVKFYTTGTGNNGKYYSDWRLYNNGNGNVIVKAYNNYVLTSITYTFSTSNSGCLSNANGSSKTALVTSGTAIALSNVESVEYKVANTNSSTNGQVRITAISVTYQEKGGQQGPTALTDPAPQYDDLTKTVTWTTDENASEYQIKVDNGSYSKITTESYDASGLEVAQEHTVYIKAVGDETNYSSKEGFVKFTPTAVFVSKDYVLCTSTDDLEVGAKYIFTSGMSGNVKAMSTESNANNRKVTDVSIDGTTHRAASTQLTLVVELGGSEDHWTFKTTNYSGTDGYFASNGTSNHLKIQSTAGEATISFTNSYVVIHLGPSTSNDLVRYNSGSTLFSCYSSGQSPVYLWKEYKELSSLTVIGTPDKTNYYDSEAFDPTGITSYTAVYTDESTRALSANAITWPSLTAGMTTIKGYYEENGKKVYTPEYSISVSADTLSTVSLSGTMKQSYYLDSEWSAGDLVVTANYASGESNVVTDQATFAYFSDSAMNNQISAPGDLGVVTNQTVYVKATFNSVSNATGYEQTISVSIEPGTTIDNPLTAAQAIAIGNTLENQAETSKVYYIQGTISEVDGNSLNNPDDKWVTFWLKDGDKYDGFQAYKIVPAEGCTNYEDIRSGAEVLIQSNIKKYGTIIETGSTKSLLSVSYVAPALESIAFDKTSMVLTASDESQIDTTLLPFGAEATLTWISSDNAVAIVDSTGKVTAVANGLATITAFADTNSNGVVDGGEINKTCSVEVYSKSVMKYEGTETVNMNASDNASSVNLDSNTFSVDSEKGGNGNFPGLNKAGEIRIYNGNNVIVSIDPNYTIAKIFVDYKSNGSASTVYAGSTEVTANMEGYYTINSSSFKIHASNNTVSIYSIDIFYRDANTKELVERTTTSTQLSYRYQDNGDNTFSYSDISIRFGAVISKADWEALDAIGTGIEGFGVMITTDLVITGEEKIATYAAADMFEPAENNPDLASDIADYFMPKSGMAVPPSEGDNYVWNLFKSVSYEDRNVSYVAAAYVKVNGEYVFLEQECYSVVSLAKDYLENRNCTDATADGSLDYLSKQVAQNN